MNYAEMSDFEINKAVGEITLKGRWASKPNCSGNDSDSWHYGSVDTFITPYIQLPDYCNSWADAGPIIEQHNISILCGTMCMQKAWEAMTPNGEEHWWEEKNPLRAAMIVFLMMQESKK